MYGAEKSNHNGEAYRFSRPLHGFSLRTLLIATTLIAVVLGAAVWEMRG